MDSILVSMGKEKEMLPKCTDGEQLMFQRTLDSKKKRLMIGTQSTNVNFPEQRDVKIFGDLKVFWIDRGDFYTFHIFKRKKFLFISYWSEVEFKYIDRNSFELYQGSILNWYRWEIILYKNSLKSQ